jgi:hypothetical protein
MNQIHGMARDQIEFSCLEDMIGKDSPVRVMDAFVDKVDLSKLGFQTLSCVQPPQCLYAKQTLF